MHYESKQAILEEAGLAPVVNGEVLAGLVDGTNATFNTTYKPVTDNNDDDEIDTTDVTVYVNGVPVFVQVLTEATGTILLRNAPASGAVVTCDYRYSNVSDSYVEKIREEAESWINDSMDAIESTPYGSGIPGSNDHIPMTVRKLTRWYAAAQLLLKDYGFNHDTALTSKDGASKMKLAEAALDKYISIGGDTGLSDVAAADLDVYAEPDLFSTVDGVTGYRVSVDDAFMRDLGPGEYEDPPWSS